MVSGPILILGAGPTGLGSAHRLLEKGFTNFQILEAAATPGGLASSVVDARGFVWDLGGHVQFSHYAYFDQLVERMLGGAWLEHQRESWIWIKKRFVPYPFQYNIHYLDAVDQKKIVHGLEELSRERLKRPVENFESWILETFGDDLSELFMIPYNKKVWGYPLSMLDSRWVGERIAVPDVKRIKKNIQMNADDRSWGPNNLFRFPLQGGTGGLWSAVAKSLPKDCIHYGISAEQIDPIHKIIKDRAGNTFSYDTLITTIPLDLLTQRIDGIPARLLALSKKFLHSSVHVLGIGLKGIKPESLKTKCWMYFPEDNSPYYRVTVFSNYSPRNVPSEEHWSLMAEVSESPNKPVDSAELEAWTLKSLREDNLIDKNSEVVSFWQRKLDYGYPTPFLGRDAALSEILPWLERHEIYSRGRFGAWKYEVSNQDHSFMQGVELVNRLLADEPEVTITDPVKANSGIFLGK